MKPILFIFGLLLWCIATSAQESNAPAPSPPTFESPEAVAARREAAKEAVRRALEARSNTLAAAAATNTSVQGAASAPSLPAPRPAQRPLPTVRSNVPEPGGPSAPVAAPGQAPGTAQPGAPSAAGAVADQPLIAVLPPSGSSTNVSMEDNVQAMIDFRGVDLPQVLTIYAELVGRTVLRPTSLPAQNIWLTAATPLTRKEGIQALDAVLGLNGVTMINVGEKFVKAVQQAQANTEGAPFSKMDASELPELGPYTTHVVQLKYAKPSEMTAALQPFAKIPNAILPIDSSQIVVLRDYAENVKRMLEMVKQIDVSIPSEYISEVIPIKYAIASDIANALNSLGAGGGGATVGTGGASTGTMGGGMGTGFGGRSSMGMGMGSRGGGYGRGGYGGYGGSSGYGGYGGYGGVTPYANVQPVNQTDASSKDVSPFATVQPGVQPGATTPGSSFTDRLRNIINRASKDGDIQVIGQTKIIADERTNSLLIFATREDMKTIKDIVAKLDVVLAQVLIEAVIIEVRLNNNMDMGISYIQRRASTAGDFTGIGALNNTPIIGAGAFSGLTNGTGLAGGFHYLANLGGDLDVYVKAIAGDGRARILQRPRLQTSHAIPAHLFVGESRPYPTGSYYGGGSFGGYSSIQQMQIGVSLDVKPLINPDGLVVMEIQQSIESVTDSVRIDNVGEVPVTATKQASAQVAVRDRDTIILGGMIETTKRKTQSGMPFLKDIPLLGFLFRSSSESEVRGELIVLLRPTVLPTPEIAALNAKAEKNNMPAVRQVEREMQADDALRLRAAEEEERLLEEEAATSKTKKKIRK